MKTLLPNTPSLNELYRQSFISYACAQAYLGVYIQQETIVKKHGQQHWYYVVLVDRENLEYEIHQSASYLEALYWMLSFMQQTHLLIHLH